MLEDAPPNRPLTIYVPASGTDEVTQARLASVQQFWRDSRWASLQLQAKAGTNPDLSAPASAGIAGLRKLEKEESRGNVRNTTVNFNAASGGGQSSGGNP
jgi:hypothetical protein